MVRLMKKIQTLLVILFIPLFLAACDSAEDRKADYLKKAELLFVEGDYEKAQLEYKNVLQIDPQDVDAQYKLGLIMEQMQDFRAAAGHYARVIELDENYYQAYVKLGKFYLLAGNFNMAMENAEKAVKLAPNDVEALAFRGMVSMQQGEVVDAARDADAALLIDSANIDAIAIKASIQFKNNQPEAAIKLLEQGILANPADTRLKIVLAGVYGSRKEFQKAADVLNQLISLEPQLLSHRLMLAGLYVTMENLDKAETVLRDATQTNVKDNQPKLALIQFLAEKRSQETAINELTGLISKDADNRELQFVLSGLFDAKGEPEKAADIYKNIIKMDELKQDGITARNRLADLYVRQKRVDEAKVLINEVIASNVNDPDALTLRGRLALSDKNPSSAIADFRSVLRNQPDSVTLHRLLAMAHTINKEPDLALDLIKRAVILSPADVRLRAEYVRLLATTQDSDEMLRQLDAILKIEPDNLEVMDAVYKIQVSRQDFTAASKVAAGMMATYPDRPVGYYYSGLISRARKDPDAGIAMFEKAVELGPQNLEPLTQLVSVYRERKDTDAIMATLDKLLADNNKNAVAHYLKGETLLSLNDAEAALKSYNAAIEMKPEWPLPYLGLGNLYLKENKVEDSIKVYEQGITATSGSLLLVTDLARIYEIEGKIDDSIRLYESALLKDPSSLLVANNLAMMLVDYRGDADSLNRASDLVEAIEDTDNPAYLDTIGWLLYKQDKAVEAVPYLEKAVAGAQDSAGLHYHLGMAYVKAGNNASAKEHLQKALESGQTFLGMDEAKEALQKL